MKLLFALLLLLSSATFAQSSFQKNAASDIQKVMLDQAAAWNKGDLDAFMTIGYWKSENLIFVSGDKITRGWQQTLDNYKRTYGTADKMGKLTFSDLEINVLSKDAATVLGSWSLQRTSDNPKGKFTLVFRKFKEGWRIVQDHSS
jgi:ketosteroid isomerase-like protein